MPNKYTVEGSKDVRVTENAILERVPQIYIDYATIYATKGYQQAPVEEPKASDMHI